MHSKVKEILNTNNLNEINSRNKIIKFSKTEIDLVKNFPNLNEIEIKNNRNYDIYKLSNARSFKLNYTDLNKYMSQVHNINSTRVTQNKGNKMTLNKYFNINKINLDNKIINSNTVKTLYNNTSLKEYNNIKNKYNSFITRKDKTSFINGINNKTNIYNETGNIINNNIKNNINKIKKEKELLKLKKVLNELKTKNNNIQNEISFLKERNAILEHNKIIKNKKLFINIKNILQKIVINNENKNYNNILKNDNTKKLYNTLSYKEKIDFISKIYFEEKLKNSFIDKTYLLFLKIKNKKEKENENEINGTGVDTKDMDKEVNIENIWKWIIFLIENIDKLNKNNYNIKKNIDNAIKEKEIYKKYYYNWINIFNVKEKEELIKNIDSLVDDKNINANEEAKMYKMLLSKKD